MNIFSGNSKLNAITSQGRYELLILLEDEENNKAFARYDLFKIDNAISNYKLSIGEYSGTAGKINIYIEIENIVLLVFNVWLRQNFGST